MKKTFIILAFLVLPLRAFADTLVLEGPVDVPASCEVTDSDGVLHSYEASSANAYLGICALDAAEESGLVSTIGLSNAFPAFGLFAESINEVIADSSSQYWAILHNGGFASAGLTTLPIAAGDTLVLELRDFSDNPTGDKLTMHIQSLIATSTPDTTPPIITAPADQTFATTTFPASILLTPATAADDTDQSPVVTYAPTSFPHGTTTVTWTATDASGNSTTTTSNVGVFLGADITIDVPASCTATDTDNVVHQYEASSSSAYLGICAFEAARENGSLTSVDLSNQFPSFGLFVVGIDGVAADPSSQYWSIYQNGNFASSGLTSLPINAGDTITLQLHDFSDNNQGDQIVLHIASLIATSTSNNSGGGGGPGGGGITHTQFDIPKALGYLAGKQKQNGSFDSDNSSFYSDWAAIAFGASEESPAKTSLRAYLQNSSPVLSSATDYERHIMALQSLGINPYSDTSVNYITSLLAKFDGTQMGDAGLDNDDIFALFPLLHSGYSSSDDIIKKEAAFIIGRQQPNGSWDNSPDMTGAAIQALGPLFDISGVNAALGKAVAFLKSQQQNDGGWSNIDSTSWVQTAINAIPNDPNHPISWASGIGMLPSDAIGTAQQTDGAVKPFTESADNRVWSTGYAIVAASGRSWVNILQSFGKPAVAAGTGGGGGSPSSATSTATSTASTTPSSAGTTPATTTPPTASSTPATASTTPTVLGASTSTVSTSTPTTTPKTTVKKAQPKPKITTPTATTATTTPTTPQPAAADAASNDSGLFGTIIGFFKWLIRLI